MPCKSREGFEVLERRLDFALGKHLGARGHPLQQLLRLAIKEDDIGMRHRDDHMEQVVDLVANQVQAAAREALNDCLEYAAGVNQTPQRTDVEADGSLRSS